MKKAWMLILALAILSPIVWAGTPITFQVVVSDSSFLVDSLGLCGQFDTLWPDTGHVDSAVVYEMVNGAPVTLANYGSVPVNSVQIFFWKNPQPGFHTLCVAAYSGDMKGCENCLTLYSKLLPPKAKALKP